MEVLTFGGKRLSEFSCYWDGSEVFRRAERIIEKYEIEGISGDIIYTGSQRYSNFVIPFNCLIKENFRGNYTALMDYLQNTDGYQILRTTEEPDCFREAVFHAMVQPQMNSFNQSGQFIIEFDCKPQLWLDEGQYERHLPRNQGTHNVYNPTYSKAYPLFRVPGNCTISFPSLGPNKKITIEGYFYAEDLMIDIKENYVRAYGAETGANYSEALYISDSWSIPYLKPGNNVVELITAHPSDTFTMKARYYRL